jgi:prenyltransferase beta subunit
MNVARDLVFLVALTAPGAAAEEAAPPALELRVNHAVDRGCDFILSKQEEGGGFGTWDKVHPIGRTALALLALLHGGVAATEPRVARGVDYLLARIDAAAGSQEAGKEERRSTYETGIALMLLYDLGPSPRFASRMEPLARFLVANFDRGHGLWGYPEGNRDLSNSQYAILGLRAAARRDIRPAGFREVVHGCLSGILACQRGNGGFGYMPDRYASGSMTVAGLAMIRWIQGELERHPGAGRDLAAAKKAIPLAEAWLEKHFSVEYNPEGLARNVATWPYYLYGLERYAAFYERRRIADRDWYREGAEALLAAQKRDGSWGNLEDTCFAILFLEKASLTGPGVRDHDAAPPPALADEPQRTPAEELPFVREWLVCGPFQETSDDDALIVDHIGEAKARPAHGRSAGRKGKWQRHLAIEDKVDLIRAIAPKGGIDFDRCAAYAATWLEVETDVDATLWLDCDDGIRVFVDGALIHEDHHHDSKEGIVVDLALAKGRRSLLLKVENVGYYCWFKARLSARSGEPLPGVSATTRQ